MATELDKENIAEGLSVPVKSTAPSPSPKKGKKSRSKSMGAGGLVPLKDETLNRRKSVMMPTTVKSILSKDDEAKRREARRKSLANRRVSFAPEATLHTWDVIEYMRDATTSSASSESTRRQSSMSQASSAPSPQSAAQSSDPAEPPSTPPEQVEEPLTEASPGNQRDLHQKKHRRRSLDAEDAYSSSPVNGSSPAGGDDEDSLSSDDEQSTAMDLDLNEATQRSESSTGSSLEERLRQAAAQAGTHGIDYDENGEMSMEIAGDDITAAFKPWIQKSNIAHELLFLQDQENVNPFSPAFKNSTRMPHGDEEEMSMDITRAIGGILQRPPPPIIEDDVSMDITRVVGGILSSAQTGENESSDVDATMDFTMVMGGIKDAAPKSEPGSEKRAALKRRRSSIMASEESQGSPAKRPSTRRQSMRRRRSSLADATLQDAPMDMTMALGSIKEHAPLQQEDRRSSIDTSFRDATMDFTMVAGGIRPNQALKKATPPMDASLDEDEDLSMELTAVIEGIQLTEAAAKPQEMQDGNEENILPGTSEITKSPLKSPKNSPARPTSSSGTKPAWNSEPGAAVELSSQDTQSTPNKAQRRSSRSNKTPETPEARPVLGDITPAVVNPESSADNATNLKSNAQPDETNVLNAAVARIARHDPSVGIVSPAILKSADRRASITPRKFGVPESVAEQPAFKGPLNLTENLKLLSTPRKQIQNSPVKRPKTPSKTPEVEKQYFSPRHGPTPRRSPSPKKRAPVVTLRTSTSKPAPSFETENTEEPEEQIELGDFLRMTNVRFMDLTTTKRRPTGFAPALRKLEDDEDEDSKTVQEPPPSLESCVTAAACTAPMLDMFAHACHELKKDIADGRTRAREIEADVSAANPPLFREYINAPPAEKAIMDNQFKNIKTNARLKSKQLWYGWRSQLLEGVKAGLVKHQADFTSDDVLLRKKEKILDAVLPALVARHEELEAEHQHLQQRAHELAGEDQQELNAAREHLKATDADIAERKALLAHLQQEVSEQETAIEAIKERKADCTEEIKAAERVREECRGWSASDVCVLKSKLQALEQKTNWSITTATSSPQTLTLVYRSDLQLFLHPTAFLTKDIPNAPISLRYVGADDSLPKPRPLTTTKRFFLQLLRAHLHCLSQSQTSLRKLLALVAKGWDAALAIAEQIRQLELTHMVDEAILSDDKLAVSIALLLPALRTKVSLAFEATVQANEDVTDIAIDVRVKNMYGERYDEAKIAKALIEKLDGLKGWAEAVDEIRGRLIKRGKKP